MFDWLKKKRLSNGPDFTKIDSQEKAKQLAVEGVLSKLYLLPLEFGGDDAPPNIVYVPHFVQDIKHGIDTNTVAPLVSDGKVTRYTAAPKYQGKSFIPNAIEIRAFDPGDFKATIQIWGEALQTDDGET